jgi:uncharacterized protein YceK
MRKRGLWATGGIIFLSALSGCGTVSNLSSGNPQPYGGVTADLERCSSVWHPKLPHGWFPGEMVLVTGAQAAIFSAHVIDVPLSAVGDTLTLPLTNRSTDVGEPK